MQDMHTPSPGTRHALPIDPPRDNPSALGSLRFLLGRNQGCYRPVLSTSKYLNGGVVSAVARSSRSGSATSHFNTANMPSVCYVGLPTGRYKDIWILSSPICLVRVTDDGHAPART